MERIECVALGDYGIQIVPKAQRRAIPADGGGPAIEKGRKYLVRKDKMNNWFKPIEKKGAKDGK